MRRVAGLLLVIMLLTATLGHGSAAELTLGPEGLAPDQTADLLQPSEEGNLTPLAPLDETSVEAASPEPGDEMYAAFSFSQPDAEMESAPLEAEMEAPDALPEESPDMDSIQEVLPPWTPRFTSMNGGFLILNMHGALFHSNPRDMEENVAYARWMKAGVIRVFATDNNSLKQWDGKRVGEQIADAAPALRRGGVKLIVALVNNHRPVPGEASSSFGWMEDYDQLLLPFYMDGWRGAYLTFVRDLIMTVRDRGALDVIFAWELGNELHTPREPKALIPFVEGATAEIRLLDPWTPILPGTMGVNHLEPWNVRSEVARWLYCEAPVDGYTLHAYDWVSRDRQGDMPISWDLDYTTFEPCESGRKLPVIVEELGTSRFLPNVYVPEQESKRLEQELRQLRFVLGFPRVIGIGAWNGESPRVADRIFYDNTRGLTSYGSGGRGGGSGYDPLPDAAPGARAQLEEILRNLPRLP